MPRCFTTYRRLWTVLLLTALTGQTAQAIKLTTTPVHGRAPVATLSVNNTRPHVGDTITATPVFSDADGDAVHGTDYQWLLDGKVLQGENSLSHVLTLNDIKAGRELNVSVTPQTDPATTQPSVGPPAQLAQPITIRWQRVITRLVWVESPSGVVADGITANTVHALVQYLDGSPAVGVPVQFTVDDVSVRTSQVMSSTDGVATLSVTNTLAGITHVTASIDDDTQSVDVHFTAGLADSVHAEVTRDNALANGADVNSVIISVLDSQGNPVMGETVHFTATNGVQLLAESGQTDNQGEVKIALTSQAAVVSQVTATTGNGISSSVNVEFFKELHMTHILVNGASFSATGGFPETGFVGAAFQLVVGEAPAQNADYTWHADQSWVSVDSMGNVTFTHEPSSANRSVTITARHKTNGSSLSYRFSVRRWFINNSYFLMGHGAASDWCSAQGRGYVIPGFDRMTDRTPQRTTGAERDANGRLWNEWGRMDSYGNGWYSGNYWVQELTQNGNARHYVYLGNGNLFSFPLNGTTYVTCTASR